MFPEEKKLIEQLANTYNGLKAYGWREIVYAPRDGSEVLVVCPGSSGVFLAQYATYLGRDVGWVVSDGQDLYMSRPILFRKG